MSRLPKNSLGLRDFMHRARVLQQYREFLRELRGIPASTAEELRVQIREGFRSKIGERNKANQKGLLLDGTRQLQQLRTYVGFSRHDPSVGGGLQAEDGGGSSWVGTGESWDVRGRLGKEWPWS